MKAKGKKKKAASKSLPQQAQAPKAPSFDQLKAFYALAEEVLDLGPWTFMQESEIFAIELPDGEVFYATIIGSGGMNLGCAFYRGKLAWHNLMRMRSRDSDPGTLLATLDCLNLDFDPWSTLQNDARTRLQRVNWEDVYEIFPNPIVYRAGRQPAAPDAAQLATLTQLIEAALPVLKHSQDNPKWLQMGPDDTPLFHAFHPGQDRGDVENESDDENEIEDVQGEWRSIPPLVARKIEVAPPDQLAIARMKQVDLKRGGAWEILVGDSHAAVADAEGAFRPLMGFFVDASTGFVAGFALATLQEMPQSLPGELLKAMQKHGVLPEALHVKSEEIALWLRDTAENLGIPILMKDSLPEAENAKAAMAHAMVGMSAGRPKKT